MKKVIYLIVFMAMFFITGCEKELDTVNLYEKSIDNYYKTPTDIEDATAGVYNAIYVQNAMAMEPIAAGLMSDLMLGGGGPDDKTAKWTDTFEDPVDDTYNTLWIQSYNGISRANAIIENAEDSDFSAYFDTEAEAQLFKDQAIGEAYFMRGFYFFRLVKFFGGVPLITTLETPRDIARATITETYAQVASDFVTAIDRMPTMAFPSIPESNYGHANKWVAEAYLGRAFLYYTGYMTNIENQATSTLPLVDGGTLSATDVTAYLDDCIQNSGYKLVEDFRNLWPYSYVNTVAQDDTVLPWAAAEGLAWAGQDGVSPTFGTGNYETMFMQRFSFGDWGWDNGNIYTNRYALFTSIRGNSLTPFGEGWGWCTVVPSLYNQWEDADPRKVGSILVVGDEDQGTEGYQPSKGDNETGFFNKKYTAIQNTPAGGGDTQGMFIQMYDWGNADYQLMHAQDFIFMRFADVLLMHSEITGTADGMNRVRARAGLAPVGYSLAALKQERLHELAFEGLRWFDIVRWGDVESAFNYSIPVNNSGVVATYTATYRPETKGLVSIPESQVRLSNGVYEQNPGW